MPIQIYDTDGSMDFVMGVDSGKVTLVQSASNPNGLRRDQTAWQVNCTNRGGGITQRPTWKKLTRIAAPGSGLFQGATIYQPINNDPYLITSIAGAILQVPLLAGAVPVNLSALFGGLFNPALNDQSFFIQGEEFLVIQAGDNVTKPLFWYDNPNVIPAQLLVRSRGITGVVNPVDPNRNQLPAATCMDYYQNRIWYAQFRTYTAGDIVGGASGTAPFQFRDSILYVTENPLAIGGDGFTVPTFSGNIRALNHAAVMDSALGTSQLFAFTSKNVYGLVVPVTRTNWIAATANNQPEQRVIQKRWGCPAERAVVAVNGDLYYQTLEPAVRSLMLSLRYFQQFGNTPISRNVNRALGFNNRALMRLCSGMLFDNRVWQSCLPFQTQAGVACSGIVVLDFDLISSFQDKLTATQIPAWEGIYSGLNHLQILSEDVGGLERAFSIVYANDGGIDLWELSLGDQFENGDNRVEWQIEFPAYDANDMTQFKELQAADIWVDRLYGTVDFTAEYRTDFDPCWRFWHKWQRCVARNTCEDTTNNICYPIGPGYEGYGLPMTLPHPPRECDANGVRPAFKGRFFQVRLTIKGFCRVRGILLYTTKAERNVFQDKVC